MASTVEARRLTEAHRVAQGRIGRDIVRQIISSWPLLDPLALDATFERWLATVLPLIRSNRASSARLAASYIDMFKKLELGAAASTKVVLTEALNTEAVSTSLLVTGPVSIKSAVARAVPLERASTNALVRVAGAATRHVLEGGRSTISDTVKNDRQALGWARATSGKPCHFCAMLASRGPVYKGAETADFQPHDACHCEPEPIYREGAAWPTGSERYQAIWQQAARDDGDTTANFRRLIEAA
jgi:hypothetical protein